MMRIKKILMVLTAMVCVAVPGKALSFALDSVAEWGKFPRFCVNTYRWGDRFFNSYDSAYVKGTGYKMNVKLRTNSWIDDNRFLIDHDCKVEMRSPSTNTIGFDITYLAVSLGYDFNINKLFGGVDRRKSKFNFDFTCALFTASLYSIKNDVGMNLKRVGDMKGINEKFYGVRTSSWGIEAVYFFNNKRYSYAAAFSISKLQLRSQGSFFVGFSYNNQDLNFDFAKLPDYLKPQLPEEWHSRVFTVKEQTCGVKGGYAYNWVPAKHYNFGVSEAVIPSVSKGKQSSVNPGCSFRLYNRLNLSVTWNNRRWFAGIVGKTDVAVVADKKTILANSLFSVEMKVGWRFNLW